LLPFLTVSTSVLIVDDEPTLRKALSRDLSRRGFDVCSADTVDAALDILIQARVVRRTPIDVLLVDLRLAGFNGLDLLRAVRKVSDATRCILMSGHATAKDEQVARDLGAVTFLSKPFTMDELLAAIRKAADCKTGFHGELHGLSLVDVLQMLHFGRRSVLLAVGGTTQGKIYLRDGEIVHAETESARGEAALCSLLCESSGFLKTSALPAPLAQTISRPFEPLLLDSLRRIDEQRVPSAATPPASSATGPPSAPPRARQR
jgi:DNA-binding response OmpR family regulator